MMKVSRTINISAQTFARGNMTKTQRNNRRKSRISAKTLRRKSFLDCIVRYRTYSKTCLRTWSQSMSQSMSKKMYQNMYQNINHNATYIKNILHISLMFSRKWSQNPAQPLLLSPTCQSLYRQHSKL